VAIIGQQLYGSPFLSGYGPVNAWFETGRVWPNAKNYGRWLVESQTPLVFLGLAILVPHRALWPRVNRSILGIAAAFVAAVWTMYLLYLVFDAWWFLRFLLPTWPFIMVGVGAVAACGLRSRSRVAQFATAGLVVLLGVHGLRFAIDQHIFQTWKYERRYPSVALQIRPLTDRNSVFLSMMHSGSLRYYAGRMSVRYDWLPSGWLDIAVAWFSDHGMHPYMLVDEDELTLVRARFPAQHTLAVLDRAPVFVYHGQQTVLLFDLSPSPAAPLQPPRTFDETFRHLRSVPPAPPPRLIFPPGTVAIP